MFETYLRVQTLHHFRNTQLGLSGQFRGVPNIFELIKSEVH
jgi:hypothetical protein